MKALSLFSFAVVLGCAPGPFAVEVHHAGKVDPIKDEEVADKAQDLPWDGDYKVEVIQATLPDGLSMRGADLVIDANHRAQYEYLGLVKSYMEDSRQVAFAKSFFWFESMHPSAGSGRDIYCKVQFPLRTLTLGIWALVSPFSWPCWVLYSRSAKKNMPIQIGELKRAAAAMGGNLVILGAIDDVEQTYVQGGPIFYSTGHETVMAGQIRAFVLRDNQRPPPM